MTDFALNSSDVEIAPVDVRTTHRKPLACRSGFALFIILNVILFIRPTDLLDSLQGLPIYQILIGFCVIASFPAMMMSLTGKALGSNPGATCVLALLPAIILASLSHFDFWWLRSNALDFFKLLIYFVLLISLISTRARLELFLKLVMGMIVVMAVLSLLAYEGVLDVPGLIPIDQHMGVDDAGEYVSVPRLVGPGIFNDPNDFSIVLVTGLVICWKLFSESKNVLRYPLLLPASAVMAVAFFLTRSRGGMLSLIGALDVLRSKTLKTKM